MNRTFMEKYKAVADSIDGWFDWVVICPVLEMINNMQEKGNILEIGIHHGKSFIPMTALLRNDEIAVAVDVFEDQHLNCDNSGRGCSFNFHNNLLHFYTHEEISNKIRIVKNDSTTMKDVDYLKFTNGEKYRLISIDGCHTQNATLIDLTNAVKILSSDGVIILDDYFNLDWPGVKFGIDLFLSENNDHRLIYLGANKFMLCHRDTYCKYMSILQLPNNSAVRYESRCWNGNVFKR